MSCPAHVLVAGTHVRESLDLQSSFTCIRVHTVWSSTACTLLQVNTEGSDRAASHGITNQSLIISAQNSQAYSIQSCCLQSCGTLGCLPAAGACPGCTWPREQLPDLSGHAPVGAGALSANRPCPTLAPAAVQAGALHSVEQLAPLPAAVGLVNASHGAHRRWQQTALPQCSV